MTEALKRISFDEFSKNLARIFEQVISEGESILIEKGEGKLVEVKPIAPAKLRGKAVTNEDDDAFLSAAGGWADVDVCLNKQTALEKLREHWPELREYHVRSLAIFGSVARDEAGPGSDVDILVEYDQPVGLFTHMALQERLGEILGCTVDLVTSAGLHEALRDRILAEAVYA